MQYDVFIYTCTSISLDVNELEKLSQRSTVHCMHRLDVLGWADSERRRQGN